MQTSSTNKMQNGKSVPRSMAYNVGCELYVYPYSCLSKWSINRKDSSRRKLASSI